MKTTDKKRGFARAHTNIALIKYWGKVDSELIIPANDSVSLTLDEFYTDTVVNFSEDYKVNEFWLNGNLMPYKHMARINRVIDAVKEEYDYPGFAKIRSFNHVPTSAGLASSASGMAALAGAAADALGDEHDLTNISRIARLGSGSASRSVFGGIVHWHRGSDHESSFVEQVVNEKDIDLNMVTVPNVKVLCQNKDILAIRNFLKNYFEERQLVIARPGSGIKFSKN